jgi:hypothetical protein
MTYDEMAAMVGTTVALMHSQHKWANAIHRVTIIKPHRDGKRFHVRYSDGVGATLKPELWKLADATGVEMEPLTIG